VEVESNDVYGHGSVNFTLFWEGKEHQWIIPKAFYVPNARRTILSEGQLLKLGYEIDPKAQTCSIIYAGTLVVQIPRQTNNILIFDNDSIKVTTEVVFQTPN
jgi:hypothetical protein